MSKLVMQPAQPLAGQKAQIFFRVKPNDGIEPYLGAMAHLLAASSDLIDMIHTHPLQAIGPRRRLQRTPVQFDFPERRIYRVWVQSQRKGVVNTVAFNVPVRIELAMLRRHAPGRASFLPCAERVGAGIPDDLTIQMFAKPGDPPACAGSGAVEGAERHRSSFARRERRTGSCSSRSGARERGQMVDRRCYSSFMKARPAWRHHRWSTPACRCPRTILSHLMREPGRTSLAPSFRTKRRFFATRPCSMCCSIIRFIRIDATFAIHSSLARLGVRVTTDLRFLPPDAPLRTFEFEGDPGLFRFDPTVVSRPSSGSFP